MQQQQQRLHYELFHRLSARWGGAGRTTGDPTVRRALEQRLLRRGIPSPNLLLPVPLSLAPRFLLPSRLLVRWRVPGSAPLRGAGGLQRCQFVSIYVDLRSAPRGTSETLGRATARPASFFRYGTFTSYYFPGH